MSTPHLPIDACRCTPNARRCPQADRCARATDWPIGTTFTVVDGSVCMLPDGWCALFIDQRGIALTSQSPEVA